MIVKNETVYAGCQDGHVKVWDLETKTLVRSIIVQEGVDVLSISMAQSELYTASANGYVQVFVFAPRFTLFHSLNGHSPEMVFFVRLHRCLGRSRGRDCAVVDSDHG